MTYGGNDSGKSDPNLLHVYAQEGEHMDAYIVGDTAGLSDLINTLVEALVNGHAQTGFYASDGEGYDLMVMRRDEDWQDPDGFWRKARLPYAQPGNWYDDALPLATAQDKPGPDEIWVAEVSPMIAHTETSERTATSERASQQRKDGEA